MPGVRYGPDIADDAATIVDRVKDIQSRIRRGVKLDKKTDRTFLSQAKQFAQDVFGVSGEDFDSGKLGLMGEMARYGLGRDRARVAKSWRDGSVMTKAVAQEMSDRERGVSSPGSKRKVSGETFYTGRTKTKRFRQLEAIATNNANRNGAKMGRSSLKRGQIDANNFKRSVDRLQVTKTRGDISYLGSREQGSAKGVRPVNPNKTGRARTENIGVRPPLGKSVARRNQGSRGTGATKAPKAKSAKGAKKAQTKRSRTVKNAGKGSKSTAKGGKKK